MKRKNVSCDLIDSTIPTSNWKTGPWQQTTAAAAALELVNDVFMTLYSANDEVQTIEVEVSVIDQTGKSLVYVRPDGLTREQILEQRAEQDARRIVMYIIWPGELEGFLPDECKDAKMAAMDNILMSQSRLRVTLGRLLAVIHFPPVFFGSFYNKGLVSNG